MFTESTRGVLHLGQTHLTSEPVEREWSRTVGISFREPPFLPLAMLLKEFLGCVGCVFITRRNIFIVEYTAMLIVNR